MNIKSNPPLIKVKKENFKIYTDHLLLPSSQYLDDPLVKKEFEYLQFTNSSLYLLYKNEKPVGQYVETHFNDTVCLSNFFILEAERHQGYGHLLIEEFYNLQKNKRICCTCTQDAEEFFVKKLNLKKVKRFYRAELDFDRKSMDPILESQGVKQVKKTESNTNFIKEYIFHNYGYHRDLAIDYYLKHGVIIESHEEGEGINGLLLASRVGKDIRIDDVIADSLEVACELMYYFLKNLENANFKILMSIAESDKFSEFAKTFNLKVDQEDIAWIMDSNLNCSYDNFYCISKSTL